MSLVKYTPNVGNVFRAYAIRKAAPLAIKRAGVLGDIIQVPPPEIPPGDVLGVPPHNGNQGVQPDWNQILWQEEPQGKPYRPSKWGRGQTFWMTQTLPVPGSSTGETSTTWYWFDAVFRADHASALTITAHPTQTGANISDHAYREPYRLVLNIGISDAMDVYDPEQYQGSTSKSIAAYDQFLAIQESRMPVTINTRLKLYGNMMLTSVEASEDANTSLSLKATLTFTEIMPAMVGVWKSPDQSVPVSQREQQTDWTKTGTKTPYKLDNQWDSYKTDPFAQKYTSSPFAKTDAGNFSSQPTTDPFAQKYTKYAPLGQSYQGTPHPQYAAGSGTGSGIPVFWRARRGGRHGATTAID